MTRAVSVLLAIVLAIIALPAASIDTTSNVETAYNNLHRIERLEYDSELARTRAISNSYERNFRSELSAPRLSSRSTSDLDFLLRGAYLAAFHAFDPKYLTDTLLIGSELERRGSLNNEQKATVVRVLIGYREFDKAREYLSRHPGIDAETLPKITPPEDNDAGAVVYRVSPDRQALSPAHVNLAKGTRLVFVVHPLCSFSRRAMQSIEHDPNVLSAIRNDVVWLAPVDMRLYFSDVQKWNSEHPLFDVVIAHSRSDWPMIDRWATPQFYLLENGKVVDHFSGWPEGGSMGRLRRLLRQGDFDVSAVNED